MDLPFKRVGRALGRAEMETTQLDYYRRREAQARAQAAAATDECARRAHLDLAARYSAITHRDEARKAG